MKYCQFYYLRKEKVNFFLTFAIVLEPLESNNLKKLL